MGLNPWLVVQLWSRLFHSRLGSLNAKSMLLLAEIGRHRTLDEATCMPAQLRAVISNTGFNKEVTVIQNRVLALRMMKCGIIRWSEVVIYVIRMHNSANWGTNSYFCAYSRSKEPTYIMVPMHKKIRFN